MRVEKNKMDFNVDSFFTVAVTNCNKSVSFEERKLTPMYTRCIIQFIHVFNKVQYIYMYVCMLMFLTMMSCMHGWMSISFQFQEFPMLVSAGSWVPVPYSIYFTDKHYLMPIKKGKGLIINGNNWIIKL